MRHSEAEGGREGRGARVLDLGGGRGGGIGAPGAGPPAVYFALDLWAVDAGSALDLPFSHPRAPAGFENFDAASSGAKETAAGTPAPPPRRGPP